MPAVLTRYAIPCVVVVVLAVGIALGTYALTPVNFSASCTFAFKLPPTSLPANTDVLAFQNQQAGQEVAQAGRGDIYSAPAVAVGVEPGVLAASTLAAQIPGSSNFVVSVTDERGDRAANLANRLCSAYVQRLQTQVDGERNSEVAQIQSRIAALQQSIASIQGTPAQGRTAGDQSILTADQQAVAADQQLLATVLALPPYDINVVTQAPAGVRNDTRSLTRNLLVGVVAALLSCFLVILIGEVARDQRSGRAG